MSKDGDSDNLRPEYDFNFSKGVREKFYMQYMESSNVVVLDSDWQPVILTQLR